MTPEFIYERIKKARLYQYTLDIAPLCVKDAEIIYTEFGIAVKVTGKGAKVTALMYSRELYYDGIVNTNWEGVRHGSGYLIPFYDNPLDSIL
jgi:hypothetical protein